MAGKFASQVLPWLSYQAMLPFHAVEAEKLVVQSLRLTPEDIAHMGAETPRECFYAYFNNQTAHGRIANKTWGEASGNVPESLQYFVALAGDRVVGVSGVYQAKPGYTSLIGAEPAQPNLENGNTYWLGWFGVQEEYRGKGVGIELLRKSVAEAVKRAGGNIRECSYAVYADAGAIAYYEKLGLSKKAYIEGGHAILQAPLAELAATLCIEFQGKTAAEKLVSRQFSTAACWAR